MGWRGNSDSHPSPIAHLKSLTLTSPPIIVPYTLSRTLPIPTFPKKRKKKIWGGERWFRCGKQRRKIPFFPFFFLREANKSRGIFFSLKKRTVRAEFKTPGQTNHPPPLYYGFPRAHPVSHISNVFIFRGIRRTQLQTALARSRVRAGVDPLMERKGGNDRF